MINHCRSDVVTITIVSLFQYGRHGGLMVSALDSDQAVRVQAVAGALRCVLGQDTLLSLCLSPPRCINGYRRIYCWGL